MKNYLLALLLVLSCSIAFGLEYQISGGFDFGNAIYHDSFQNSYAMFVGTEYQPGFSLSAEAMKNISNVVFGIGAEYQLKRKHGKMGENVTVSLKDISFLPVYAKLGFSFPVTHGPVPEIFTQLGYGFAMMENIEESEANLLSKWSFGGGMYYGFGFGIEFNQIVLQTLLRYNAMRAELTETNNYGSFEQNTYDHTHRQFSIKLGYRF